MDTSSFSDLGVDSQDGSESSTPEWISTLLDTHLSTKRAPVLKSSLRLGGSPLPRLDVAQGSEKWTNDCLDRLAHVQKLHSSTSRDATSEMINISDVDGLNSQDLIVGLVGSRGCGKREFLANLLGTTSAASDNMTEVKAIRCPHDIFGTESVILADTPEFDASDQRSGTAALKQVLGWMRASSAEELRPTVLLYFHPLSAQLSGNHLTNLRAFEDLCGEKNLGNVFLITTFPPESTESSMDGSRDAEIKLKNGGWKKLSKRGSAICHFDEAHCASSILQPLIYQRLAERATNLLLHASDGAQSARLQHDLATYAQSLPEQSNLRLYLHLKDLLEARQGLIKELKESIDAEGVNTERTRAVVAKIDAIQREIEVANADIVNLRPGQESKMRRALRHASPSLSNLTGRVHAEMQTSPGRKTVLQPKKEMQPPVSRWSRFTKQR